MASLPLPLSAPDTATPSATAASFSYPRLEPAPYPPHTEQHDPLTAPTPQTIAVRTTPAPSNLHRTATPFTKSRRTSTGSSPGDHVRVKSFYGKWTQGEVVAVLDWLSRDENQQKFVYGTKASAYAELVQLPELRETKTERQIRNKCADLENVYKKTRDWLESAASEIHPSVLEQTVNVYVEKKCPHFARMDAIFRDRVMNTRTRASLTSSDGPRESAKSIDMNSDGGATTPGSGKTTNTDLEAEVVGDANLMHNVQTEAVNRAIYSAITSTSSSTTAGTVGGTISAARTVALPTAAEEDGNRPKRVKLNCSIPLSDSPSISRTKMTDTMSVGDVLLEMNQLRSRVEERNAQLMQSWIASQEEQAREQLAQNKLELQVMNQELEIRRLEAETRNLEAKIELERLQARRNRSISVGVSDGD